MKNSPTFDAGNFVLFTGPMHSGKTTEMIRHLSYPYNRSKPILIKPDTDIREPNNNWIYINASKPEGILQYKNHGFIGIDEIQFFGEGIDEVIIELQKGYYKTYATGLDLDYRGIPFKGMDKIFGLATDIKKLSSICDIVGCHEPATRTQKIDEYGGVITSNSPIIDVGNNQYQVRCLEHFIKEK